MEEYREAEAVLGGGRAGGALPRVAAELMTAHAPEDGLGLMELADELEATGRWVGGRGASGSYKMLQLADQLEATGREEF